MQKQYRLADLSRMAVVVVAWFAVAAVNHPYELTVKSLYMLDSAVVSAMFLLLSEHISSVPQAVVSQCPLLDQRGLSSLLPQFPAAVPL